jgi:hypothetical protein
MAQETPKEAMTSPVSDAVRTLSCSMSSQTAIHNSAPKEITAFPKSVTLYQTFRKTATHIFLHRKT